MEVLHDVVVGLRITVFMLLKGLLNISGTLVRTSTASKMEGICFCQTESHQQDTTM
jgi:hypothetical protein